VKLDGSSAKRDTKERWCFKVWASKDADPVYVTALLAGTDSDVRKYLDFGSEADDHLFLLRLRI
jgi:hypothetical protein